MTYDYSKIVPKLLHWYDNNARILPWRKYQNPYHIWISEIMLQQTRAEVVKRYFERFIIELPEIKDLAEVSDDRLMKLWEGLGYYSRARNLKAAANIVMQEYQGRLPDEYEALLTLPGIGPYTAGAIASIAFDVPVPAVDGNVLRVMMRVSGCFEDITKASTKKNLENNLLVVMPKNHAGDLNQAIMDLGSMICIPIGEPLCVDCPLQSFCQAYKDGNQQKLPIKSKKKKRTIEEKTVFLIQQDDKFLLYKRPDTGLLAGLYELPNVKGKLSQSVAEEYLKELGFQFENMNHLGSAKHIFTHMEWHMKGYHVRLGNDLQNRYKEDEHQVWVSRKRLKEEVMLPSAFSAYHPLKV